MTKDQALAELQRIRAQLDVLGDPIFFSLEAAEDAAKDSNLARLLEASPIDRLALFRALFMTMNAVDHLATHVEYLLEKEASPAQTKSLPSEAVTPQPDRSLAFTEAFQSSNLLRVLEPVRRKLLVNPFFGFRLLREINRLFFPFPGNLPAPGLRILFDQISLILTHFVLLPNGNTDSAG